MMKRAHEAERRQRATQATLDTFKGKLFQFGRHDCAQLIKSHVRRMGRPVKGWARAGSYVSLAGGVKQLKKIGFDNLIDAMDASFERIPPAAARIGDVVAMPGVEGPGALTVALGNGRVLGWVEDVAGAVVLQPLSYDGAAWRIQ
jgi:hypothetical protein